ncbi:unnamed protein product [Heligmosomoides polygyrus]|uniref:RdRp catalytic domain-containing protein n=1 Tax=Heligmosomoides polygyrus TaxID=6339 RepID=A0A183FWR8_HELPZ|nr:unnamed protein product [Heligmosomoides polygyrus]
MKKGLTTMKTLGTSIKAVDPNAIDIITCQFKETFCESYFRKHHVWPANTNLAYVMDIDGIREIDDYFHTHGRYPKPELTDRIKRNARRSEMLSSIVRQSPINKNSKHYDLFDWKYVELQQCLEPGPHLNEVALISDKAASETKQVILNSL